MWTPKHVNHVFVEQLFSNDSSSEVGCGCEAAFWFPNHPKGVRLGDEVRALRSSSTPKNHPFKAALINIIIIIIINKGEIK